MGQAIFVDTNVLMNSSFNFEDYSKVYISIISIEELDNLKHNEKTNYQARQAIKKIMNAKNVEIRFKSGMIGDIGFLEHSNDNLILSMAVDICKKDEECVFITDDYNLILKANALGLKCEMFECERDKTNEYKGFIELVLNDEEMSDHYQNPINRWDLLNNQYLVIKDTNDKIVDKQIWTNDKGFAPINYRQINSLHIGKVKPRNIQQELAFDLFQNKNIKVCAIFGRYGTGKDYVMSAHALSMVQKGTYDKIVFVRNNYIVKNSKELGYLPGNLEDKLLPFAMPLADHIGGIDGLRMFIDQGKIELQHLGFLRGRDIKNSIVYCTEAENMTKEHLQLLISRLAEGSSLWLNGDFKQTDHIIFERNNGLRELINTLKNNELFGCVELNIVERSKVAQLASLLN